VSRPAFMDEFEKLEVELARQYEVYMSKYRCVHKLCCKLFVECIYTRSAFIL
jgi:hypothetical protein